MSMDRFLHFGRRYQVARSLAIPVGSAVALFLAPQSALGQAAQVGTGYGTQPDTRAGFPMAPPDVKAPPYRFGDIAHADLSGVWVPQGIAGVPIERPPLTPAYAAKLARTRALSDQGTPEADSLSRCIAYGMPRFMTFPFELNQGPGEIVMVSGGLTDVRRIYTDGRGHSTDFEPSYNGDSVGHWEGSSLLVETNNLVAGTMEQYGTPYSDQLTIMERFRRTGPNSLEVTFTLTDSKALTRPWVWTRKYALMAVGSRLEEDRCTNNRNLGVDGLQGAAVPK